MNIGMAVKRMKAGKEVTRDKAGYKSTFTMKKNKIIRKSRNSEFQARFMSEDITADDWKVVKK